MPTHRSHEISYLKLTDVGIALSCTIKFTNSFYIEPVLELIPDLCSQSIPEDNSHTVLLVGRSHRLRQQVAAYFADVLCYLEHQTKII